MAPLTESDVGGLRVRLANIFPRIGQPINYNVAQINAVFQALEDWVESNQVKNSVSNTIDSATSHSFTPPQKRLIFAAFIFKKAFREGFL